MQDGRRVLLLERDLSQPDRIVGELLQPGGYLMLKKLGMEDCTSSIDSQKVQPCLQYTFKVAADTRGEHTWQLQLHRDNVSCNLMRQCQLQLQEGSPTILGGVGWGGGAAVT
jgi:hypothetical protein